MEVPSGDPATQQLSEQQQMEALRMMQHQPGQGAGQPGGMPMMQSDGLMMAQQGGASMTSYYVQPHLQQHYVPQTPMGQPPVHPQAAKARLQCHACSKLLEYDAGAQYVQCFSCSTMNAVQQKTQVGGRVLSMLCAMCSTTNLAPYGINYVRCGTCHTISQVSHAYRVELQPQVQGGPMVHQQQQQPPRGYNDQGAPQMVGNPSMMQQSLSGTDKGMGGAVMPDMSGQNTVPSLDNNVDVKLQPDQTAESYHPGH